MQLSIVESELLEALYKASHMTGDIIILLRNRGIEISLDEAKRIGVKLHLGYYIKYIEKEFSADAELLTKGLEYISSSR